MEEKHISKKIDKHSREKKINRIIIICVLVVIVPIILLTAVPFIFLIRDEVNIITKNSVDDYSIILEKDKDGKDRFSFENDTYNSLLVMFPREKPEELLEFYYYCDGGGISDYAICFSYKLEENEYNELLNKAKSYKVTYEGVEHKVIYTEDDFYYKAVIFSWDSTYQDIYEYSLFDDNNHVVINVFIKGSSISRVQANCNYNIQPIKTNFIYKYIIGSELNGFNDEDLLFNDYGCFERDYSSYDYSIFMYPDGEKYKYPETEVVERIVK